MKNKGVKQGQAGFTLIEVMGAVFILSIISVGTMQYSVQASKIIAKQGNVRAAIPRARQRMDLIKAIPVSDTLWNTLPLNGVRYLSVYDPTNCVFTKITTGKPDEKIPLSTTNAAIWSLVRRVRTAPPTKGSSVPADLIEIEVSVKYGDRPNQRVFLKDVKKPVYQ